MRSILCIAWAALLTLTSCATVSDNLAGGGKAVGVRVAGGMFTGASIDAGVFDPHVMTRVREEGITLGDIRILYADELAEFSYPLSELLKPLAAHRGLYLFGEEDARAMQDTGGKGFLLDVWLREENFSRGISFRSSITGRFFLKEAETGTLIFSLSYAEDSENTIRSFRHLYRIFDILFARIAYEAKKKAPKK